MIDSAPSSASMGVQSDQTPPRQKGSGQEVASGFTRKKTLSASSSSSNYSDHSDSSSSCSSSAPRSPATGDKLSRKNVYFHSDITLSIPRPGIVLQSGGVLQSHLARKQRLHELNKKWLQLSHELKQANQWLSRLQPALAQSGAASQTMHNETGQKTREMEQLKKHQEKLEASRKKEQEDFEVLRDQAGSGKQLLSWESWARENNLNQQETEITSRDQKYEQTLAEKKRQLSGLEESVPGLRQQQSSQQSDKQQQETRQAELEAATNPHTDALELQQSRHQAEVNELRQTLKRLQSRLKNEEARSTSLEQEKNCLLEENRRLLDPPALSQPEPVAQPPLPAASPQVQAGITEPDTGNGTALPESVLLSTPVQPASARQETDEKPLVSSSGKEEPLPGIRSGTLIALPRTIEQVFKNAGTLEIPQHFVSLGYPVRSGPDRKPVEIKHRRDLLNPVDFDPQDETDTLKTIETEYTTVAEGTLPTNLQQQGIQKVWYQSCFWETFLNVAVVQNWLALPHQEVVRRLKAAADTRDSTILDEQERNSITLWHSEQARDEAEKGFNSHFLPLDWLTLLARETRDNPDDKLTQLAGCWVDFSLQMAIANQSAPAKRKYQMNRNPFDWRKSGLPGDAEAPSVDPSLPGPFRKPDDEHTRTRGKGKRKVKQPLWGNNKEKKAVNRKSSWTVVQ